MKLFFLSLKTKEVLNTVWFKQTVLWAMWFLILFAFKNNIHFLKTHTQENGLIITQYPPYPEEAIDFLRLLMDHDCSTIICLDPLHIIESVGVIWYFSQNIFETFKSFQFEAPRLLSNNCTLKANFRFFFFFFW